MCPAPVPNDDETDLEEDACVADPLSDGLLNMWNETARVNREVFAELFRPVPSNLVHNWNQYDVSFGLFPMRRFCALAKLPLWSSTSRKSRRGVSYPACHSGASRRDLHLCRDHLSKHQSCVAFYPLHLQFLTLILIITGFPDRRERLCAGAWLEWAESYASDLYLNLHGGRHDNGLEICSVPVDREYPTLRLQSNVIGSLASISASVFFPGTRALIQPVATMEGSEASATRAHA